MSLALTSPPNFLRSFPLPFHQNFSFPITFSLSATIVTLFFSVQIYSIKCLLQCSRAGAGAAAARSRIILVEPEPRRNAAPASSLMFNIGGLSKMSQIIRVSSFFHSMFYQFKSEKIVLTLMITFALKKSWLGIIRVGGGASSGAAGAALICLTGHGVASR
jgi:hypothetical protein